MQLVACFSIIIISCSSNVALHHLFVCIFSRIILIVVAVGCMCL